MKKKDWLGVSIEELERELGTNIKKGLELTEVEKRRDEHGGNVLDCEKKTSWLGQLIEQLKNPLVLMLMATAVIAGVTGQTLESGLILGIVIFMALLGVFLENKAGNAISSLKAVIKQTTMVIREGKLKEIPIAEVVVGDLLVLNEGDRVPADARVVEADEMKLDEAILTGESVPVEKEAVRMESKASLGERKNEVFGGTYVIGGKGRAVVVAVGLKMELGKIAKELAETDTSETPLQKQLVVLSKWLLWGTLVICGLILVVTVVRGESLISGLIESLSLAIAFIPEGLSAVMTVTLAIGVKEMVKKKVIIKRLVAAEGLGSVSILATDKTGTITMGKMTVDKLWLVGGEVGVASFKPTCEAERRLVEVVRYCNNGRGATELALVNFLNRAGFEFELEERLAEHRFSSDVKRMMVIREDDRGVAGYSKGAPDILLPLCSKYLASEKDETLGLTDETRKKIENKLTEMAKEGYRVLCLAYRGFEKKGWGERSNDEKDLVFLGLIGLMDPIRPEVRKTVEMMKGAGVRPVIITGDHREIARTIAIKAGVIDDEKGEVISGEELEEYWKKPTEKVRRKIVECAVFARVNPEHKKRLVEMFKEAGYIAAMAGDGVNDAVAIARADIGIAVVGGTDVVKEAADVIVTGNYDALANAVEVGRVIIQRTKLYLHYILSGNACEVGVFVLALIFNLPVPLTAVSLLIINLLTDAAPAMAMAFEAGEKGLMKQKPRPANEGLIDRRIWVSIGIQGLVSSLYLFGVFYLTLGRGLIYAQTATFTAYMFQKLLRAFTARSLTRSVLEYGWWTNKAILAAVTLALGIWLVVVYGLGGVLRMERLEIRMLGLILAGAMVFPVLEEGIKWQRRRGALGIMG